MPEWLGLVLKLLGSVGAAYFGMMALGTKARDDSGKMTAPGRVALIGILVSAALASASTIYDYSSGQSRDAESKSRSDQARLDMERLRYPLRGTAAAVYVSFSQDFPALTEYKKEMTKALPKDSHKCAYSKDFQCVDEDDDGILYDIPFGSRLYPKSGDLLRKVLDSLAISISFIKPGKGPGDDHFHRIGTLGFLPAQFGQSQALIEFAPSTGKLSYGFREVKVPDEVIAHSEIYSLADAFPGFVTASALIVNGAVLDN
jgi:hypothetical protein